MTKQELCNQATKYLERYKQSADVVFAMNSLPILQFIEYLEEQGVFDDERPTIDEIWGEELEQRWRDFNA